MSFHKHFPFGMNRRWTQSNTVELCTAYCILAKQKWIVIYKFGVFSTFLRFSPFSFNTHDTMIYWMKTIWWKKKSDEAFNVMRPMGWLMVALLLNLTRTLLSIATTVYDYSWISMWIWIPVWINWKFGDI